MPLLDLRKLTTGLSPAWAGYLRDWDRSLRAGNYPDTTRYNYLLAATQLGRYLAEHSPDPDAPDAAADPAEVTKAHVEAFQAWMIGTRSAATALNKHKALLLLGWTSEDMPRHYGASAAAERAQQIGELVEPGNDVCGQADAGHDHRDRFRSWRWAQVPGHASHREAAGRVLDAVGDALAVVELPARRGSLPDRHLAHHGRPGLGAD